MGRFAAKYVPAAIQQSQLEKRKQNLERKSRRNFENIYFTKYSISINR